MRLAVMADTIRKYTISPEHRAQFEKMGIERVRIALLRGMDIPKGVIRGEAMEWITEQDAKQHRRDNRRYWIMVALTGVAAAGASIAAWPVIHG